MASTNSGTPEASLVGSKRGEPEPWSLMERQTRTRRLFLPSQLFFFSTTYLNTWIGVGITMYYALLNGGPAAWLFNYILVFTGVMAQAATLAEFASIQPIAGAQYIWTYTYGPPSYRRFLTWIQGWTTWVGYVACLTSTINSQTIFLQAVISMNFPSYVTRGWRTFAFDIAYLALVAFTNTLAFSVVPWFELATGIVSITFFFIYLIALWTLAPHNNVGFLLHMSVSSGWNNYFVSWNIGVLSQVWLFVGFESIIQMGQESLNPKQTVPKTLFWSILANGVIGFLMLCTILMCMPPDISIILKSSSPLVEIIKYATQSHAISTFLAMGQIFLGISCSMAAFSAVSRLTWAWARDGGLPSYFSIVDGKHRVPVRAVWLTAAICAFLALLNIGSATYTALGAITSLAVLGFYFSYAIIICVALYARRAGTLKLGEWNLGRWGFAVNVFALVYTVWTMIWIPFPSTLPVTVSNMNWCFPAFATVMLVVGTIYLVRGEWLGPNQAVVDIFLCDQ